MSDKTGNKKDRNMEHQDKSWQLRVCDIDPDYMTHHPDKNTGKAKNKKAAPVFFTALDGYEDDQE